MTRSPHRLSYERPQLAAYQRQMVDCPARFTVVEAATKTGKTTACLVWLLERGLAGRSGGQYWWVAPTKRQAAMAFRRARRWLHRQVAQDWKSELRLRLLNGAELHFKSAHTPDTLYGEDVEALVLDEASRCREAAWHALRSTLTATGGPAKLIGNVKGRRNWLHQLAQRAQSGTEPQLAFFRFTIHDAVAAGLVSQAEVDEARRSLPEHVFNELYLAEPSDDGANPFGHHHLEACRRPGLSPEAARFWGIDFGKAADWTVLVGLDAHGQVARFGRFRSDWAAIRREVVQAVGHAYALADSTGVGDALVEDLQRELPLLQGFTFTQHSKQQLMEELAAAIQEHRLGLAPSLLLDELATFEFHHRPGGHVRYSAPAGLHDDAVCALALAVRCWRQNRPRALFTFEV